MNKRLFGTVSCLLLATSVYGALAIDATVSKDQGSASTTVTSPAFSTVAGQELLLAMISTDYLQAANTTVQSVSGAGLTWVLVVRANAQRGTSEIWRAFAPNPLVAASVTANLSQRVASSLTVMTFTGVDASGTNGSAAIGAAVSAGAATGAPTATLVTTRNNSWVFGVGNDFDNAIARTVATGQVLIHQFLSPAGDTYWAQGQGAPTSMSGTSVRLNDTAPTKDRYNFAICEILPSSGGGTPTWTASGSISPAAQGSGTTVSLTGTSNATVTADSSGHYSFTGLVNGPYTIRPQKTGYSFLPSNASITISGASQSGIDFSISPTATWSISGTLSPSTATAGAAVSLSGAVTASTTADGSGHFVFSGLPNGSYTVTPAESGYVFNPASQPVIVSGVNVIGINFSAAASTETLSIDATTSKNQGTASSTVSTPSFSTTSGQELLLAMIATDYLGGANTTVQSVSGAGLTWVLVERANGQSGTSEIWRAFAPAALTNISVTANLSQAVSSSITVTTFIGADPSGTNGAGAIGAVAGASAKAAPAASLVTTRNNSWVIGVGNDFDNAIARMVPSGQTMVNQYLSPVGDTYWAQRQSNPTPLNGTTVTVNDTAPSGDRFNLAICEILPNSGSDGGPPPPPAITMTSPAPGTIAGLSTVSASATGNVASVQFLFDGAVLGAAVTTAPYSTTWDTKTASSGVHNLTARLQDNYGQTATASPVTVTVDNSGNPAVAGSWSQPVSLPAVAVNLILLPNNKVLFYQDGQTPTVWDYSSNTMQSVPVSADLFCSGAALLPDGRVFVAGGYGGSGSSIGLANAEIFDPATNHWTDVPKMAYKRWYPGVTSLADGRMLVTAGWQTTAHTNAGVSEIYDPATNTWTKLTNANNPFETYPFLYQLGDGRILHIGGSEYATDTDVLDIGTQSWSVVDSRVVDGASATMYLPGQFMKAGTAADSQNVGPASKTTFVLDMSRQTPAWQQTPPMAYPRSFFNLTMLPDGTVLATGGETDQDGGNIANAVYASELWSPQTKNWRSMAAMHTPREYHGTALLLPDGRVLESGMGADFGNVPDQKSAEFYSPPYLFQGPRPTITQTPGTIQYGASFFVGTPDAANISSAVLIRTGAVTHFFDQNERFIPLNFQQAGGGLTLTAPSSANAAPPGYYMLFIVNSNGVPSIAPFVRLSN